MLDQARLWYPPVAHVQWLKKFATLPPVPVYFEALGKYEEVSIAEVVKILEEARARAVPTKRRDYCTKTLVEFVITPNSHIYVNDPLCEITTRLAGQPPTTTLSSVANGKPNTPASKSNPNIPPSGRGNMTAKVFRRDMLKKHTTITSELLESLKGSGPCSMAEVVNHLVSRDQTLVKSNDTIMSELSQLQEENRRLREDIQRYRDDASRIAAELRSMGDPYNPYDSRSGGSRGWSSDPYERNYSGYDRRY